MRTKPMSRYTLTDRRLGRYKSVDEVTEHRMFRSRQSERMVGEHFESLGYDVEIGNGKGPDLVCAKDGITLRVEVKVCVKQLAGNSWYVPIVYPARKSDDLIAIVFPNNSIHIEKMADHLLACCPSGRRTITKLILQRAA